MIKIIDEERDSEVRTFSNLEEMSDYINDNIGKEGRAIRLELYMQGGETEVFYLSAINEEGTMIIKGERFEYEPDPDNFISNVASFVDHEKIISYRIYQGYSFDITIKRD